MINAHVSENSSLWVAPMCQSYVSLWKQAVEALRDVFSGIWGMPPTELKVNLKFTWSLWSTSGTEFVYRRLLLSIKYCNFEFFRPVDLMDATRWEFWLRAHVGLAFMVCFGFVVARSSRSLDKWDVVWKPKVFWGTLGHTAAAHTQNAPLSPLRL